MSTDRSWRADALATAGVERVVPNMASAGERINDARRHVRSARALADDDPTLAMAACHDAIRKSISAHMAARGLRPRGGDGSHRIVLEYARHELASVVDERDLDDADAIRRDRGIAEYGDFATRRFDRAHVEGAADVAQRIVDAVAAALAGHS